MKDLASEKEENHNDDIEFVEFLSKDKQVVENYEAIQ